MTKRKGLFNMTFKITYKFDGTPAEEVFDEHDNSQSIEDRIGTLESLGAFCIEETRIPRKLELFSGYAKIGEALLKDCPENDCIIYRNVYSIYRAVEADYKRIIEAFPDLDESTELAITRKLLECRKTLHEMYSENCAIQRFKEGARA